MWPCNAAANKGVAPSIMARSSNQIPGQKLVIILRHLNTSWRCQYVLCFSLPPPWYHCMILSHCMVSRPGSIFWSMSREHVELNKFDWDTTDKSLYMTMIDTSLTKEPTNRCPNWGVDPLWQSAVVFDANRFQVSQSVILWLYIYIYITCWYSLCYFPKNHLH